MKLTKRERCGEREAGIGKVHSVERIESLGSEANALAFLRKPERFLQRQIRVEVRREPHRRLHSRMPGQLIRKSIRRIRIPEDTRISVLIERHPGLDRRRANGERAQPVICVVCEIAGNR